MDCILESVREPQKMDLVVQKVVELTLLILLDISLGKYVRKFGLVLSKRRSGMNLKLQGSTLFDTTQLVAFLNLRS
ncbi:hypothetical protein P8452_11107 [Trifolium repens]|nr:hypothetical protein P8452_11107 [Trifolium repens]